MGRVCLPKMEKTVEKGYFLSKLRVAFSVGPRAAELEAQTRREWCLSLLEGVLVLGKVRLASLLTDLRGSSSPRPEPGDALESCCKSGESAGRVAYLGWSLWLPTTW